MVEGLTFYHSGRPTNRKNVLVGKEALVLMAVVVHYKRLCYSLFLLRLFVSGHTFVEIV